MLLETIIIVIVTFSAIHLYLRGFRIAKYIDKIPGPPAWPIIGNSLTFMVSEGKI